MKITSITAQKRDNGRVNISVDGNYRFSLDTYQIIEHGIKIGREYNETELVVLDRASQFGKIYGRALEYCLMRPHSIREAKDYLYRKTRPTCGKTGELRPGISSEITQQILDRLIEKGYLDDVKFTNYWVENRSLAKGISLRKLTSELRTKGVGSAMVEQVLSETQRNDSEEIQKIIKKKRSHYSDDKKLIAYLARLGFRYDEIKQALN